MNTYYLVEESTILHEIGHILGIGPIWGLLSDAPIINYNGDVANRYYNGTNAFDEYKNYYITSGGPTPENLVGIPVENNGGAGTANGHPEIGNSYAISSLNNRSANGLFHPGLNSELMTGVSSGDTELSKITIGYLKDLGYYVDYNQADNYVLIIN